MKKHKTNPELKAIMETDSFNLFEEESLKYLAPWQSYEAASMEYKNRYELDLEAYKRCFTPDSPHIISDECQFDQDTFFQTLLKIFSPCQHPYFVNYCKYLLGLKIKEESDIPASYDKTIFTSSFGQTVLLKALPEFLSSKYHHRSFGVLVKHLENDNYIYKSIPYNKMANYFEGHGAVILNAGRSSWDRDTNETYDKKGRYKLAYKVAVGQTKLQFGKEIEK